VPRLPLTLARLLLPLLGWLLLAGCTDGDRVKTAAEIDEPAYREGLALIKTGRRQEALTAFLKVIDKRGEDAPESHLEIGMLYAQHINDPLSAIYHFKKYLTLRPNSPQAPMIRQRIDAATREFARTLPAQPLENQLQRVDLVATLDRLKQENEALKQELADLKAGRRAVTVPGVEPGPDTPPEPTPASSNFKLSVDPILTVRTRPAQAPTRPPAAAPARTAAATPAPAAPSITAPASTGNRRHTIRPGDTLSKISQQYYGNRTRVKDIYAANRGVMKSETDLKPGMVLRIP
jgi:tetratricopeptide (TPR) repeat protein